MLSNFGHSIERGETTKTSKGWLLCKTWRGRDHAVDSKLDGPTNSVFYDVVQITANKNRRDKASKINDLQSVPTTKRDRQGSKQSDYNLRVIFIFIAHRWSRRQN